MKKVPPHGSQPSNVQIWLQPAQTGSSLNIKIVTIILFNLVMAYKFIV